MVRWLRLSVGLAVVGMLCAGCAVVPSGMAASPDAKDIVQEMRALRRDLGTMKRAQAQHVRAVRRFRPSDLRLAVARLNRLADQIVKLDTAPRLSTDAHARLLAEVATLQRDVRRLRVQMNERNETQAGRAKEASRNQVERQRQFQEKLLGEVARLGETINRNAAQLKVMSERIVQMNQKVSLLRQKETLSGSGSLGGHGPSNVPNKSQSATDVLSSATNLCSTACLADNSTSPACHRCASCAELCFRREGTTSAAVSACRNYCATR